MRKVTDKAILAECGAIFCQEMQKLPPAGFGHVQAAMKEMLARIQKSYPNIVHVELKSSEDSHEVTLFEK